MKKIISLNILVVNFKRMWPYIKPFWGRAVLGILLTIPVGALDGAIAMFLKPCMDEMFVAKEQSFSN